ncbi:PDT-domain-containing protein [Macrolepiota fuliginosa MF-IS2]|uniref:prephenate dehydratase n=1 Tax=Macrolepiota fuliginosa MF-IS2 TaxID=1400762 RepID=A0A9P6C889_9AGAR|nr:PDT-domain-containing protein [Macrolepiota fuliginosa MF-IS2]
MNVLKTQKIRVAVLGPLGTYTHEAAHKVFGDGVEYEERQTISDTFQAIQDTVSIAVVPQENTIFGNVIETYDALRQTGCGFVKGEITLQVQHCLLVQQGVQLHEIEKILSHEQALGQCQDFLNTHLPNATRIRTPSTASAARSLLTSPRNCAAICSKICATLFDGLEVLCTGVQKEANNFTRFYIIVRDREVQLPIGPHRAKSKGLLRLWVPPAPASGTRQKDIVQYLSPSGLSIMRIDRRPSDGGPPFQSVYFVETTDIVGGGSEEPPTSDSWTTLLEEAVSLIRKMGGEVDLIGVW